MPKAEAKALYAAGKKLFDAKQYSEAVQTFKEAQTADPSYQEAFRAEGLAHIALGRAQQEKAEYLRRYPYTATETERRDIKTTISTLSENATTEYNTALKVFTAAVGLDAKSEEGTLAAHCQGSALYHLKRYDESVAHYRKLLEKGPLHPDALWGLLKSSAALVDQEDRMEQYNFILEKDPNCARAWYEKGEIHYRQGNIAEATKCYIKATTCTPNAIWDWEGKGNAHWMLGEEKKAIECYRQVPDEFLLKDDYLHHHRKYAPRSLARFIFGIATGAAVFAAMWSFVFSLPAGVSTAIFLGAYVGAVVGIPIVGVALYFISLAIISALRSGEEKKISLTPTGTLLLYSSPIAISAALGTMIGMILLFALASPPGWTVIIATGAGLAVGAVISLAIFGIKFLDTYYQRTHHVDSNLGTEMQPLRDRSKDSVQPGPEKTQTSVSTFLDSPVKRKGAEEKKEDEQEKNILNNSEAPKDQRRQ